MKKGTNYRYVFLEEFSQDNDCSLEEFGNEIVGEHFIVLRDEDDKVISFVLIGASSQYIYECIYNEF